MKEKGITLLSLVIYIGVIIIITSTIGIIMHDFTINNRTIEEAGEGLLEYSKFNIYFLKEIKKENIAIDNIGENYILFNSGNSFSLFNNNIKYNDIVICKNVEELLFIQDENDESIITVKIKFKNGTKEVKYKLEEIY